jgi:hypothetical protein
MSFMPQFNIKNLPRGFIYIAPKRIIRPMIEQFENLFTSIDYDGISMSEQNVGKWETDSSSRKLHLGILYSQSNENNDGWKFKLKLNGIREINLPQNHEEIVAEMLADIESRVTKIIALPLTASRQMGDLYLGFRLDNEKRKAKYSSFVAS